MEEHLVQVELPGDHLPDLIARLVDNITGGVSNEDLKQASIVEIGEICANNEDPEILEPHYDSIYGAITYLMEEDHSNNVRKCTATALFQFIGAFISELDDQVIDHGQARRYTIMVCVCRYILSADDDTAECLVWCLRAIMMFHYKTMQFRIMDHNNVVGLHRIVGDLRSITTEAMGRPSNQLGRECINLWVTICEEEIKLADEHKKLLPLEAVDYLAPWLLKILERQQEGDDEDQWNPHKAACECLSLLSQTCEESIVELVQQSIQHEDWRKRVAALMAFDSILEGPSPDSLGPLVTQVMPVITKLLGDPKAVVRNSAAWTFDKVCEVLPEVPLGDACLPALVHAMVAALSSEPEFATNVCSAFLSLERIAIDLRQVSTYKLSPYFANIVEQLLHTMNRPDCGQSDLHDAAYSALTDMIRSAPLDCYPSIHHTTVVVVQKLKDNLDVEQAARSAQDRSQLAEHQSLLCGVLQAVLLKINRADAVNIADQLMSVLMEMFKRAQSRHLPLKNNKKSADSYNLYRGFQQYALLSVNELRVVIGPAFSKYMDRVMQVLLACLKNSADAKIHSIVVRILRDLARKFTSKLVPYVDQVCSLLFKIYWNPTDVTDGSVYPQIISAFGDFARYLGESFAEYRGQVIQILKERCEINFFQPNMTDYLNCFGQCCIDTLSQLIVGAAAQENSDKFDFITPHMDVVIAFLNNIATEPDLRDELIGACCSLVADIATVFGSDMLEKLNTEFINNLLDRGLKCNTDSAKWCADRANKVMNNLKGV